VEEEVLEDMTLHIDNGGSSHEDDSTWVGTQYTSMEIPSSSEQVFSLFFKLKRHCPALYASLSLWEKDTLNASLFLKNITSTVAVSSGVDRMATEPITMGSGYHEDSETFPFGGRGVNTSNPTMCLGTLPVLEVQSIQSPTLVEPLLPAISSLVEIPQVAIPLPDESVPIPGCQ